MKPSEVSIRQLQQPQTPTASSDNVSHSLAGTFVFAGEVAEVGSAVDTLSPGLRAVCSIYDLTAGKQIPLERHVDASKVHPIPHQLSAEDAVELTRSYIAAAAILHQHFGVPLAADHGDDDTEVNKKQLQDKRILVIGGETLLAAAITQLFRAAETHSNVILTATMENQYMLLQRAVQLVMLGAKYAIDGAAPDLMEHLTGDMEDYVGVDAIIDVTGDLGNRREVLDLLAEGRIYLDLKTLDYSGEVARLMEKGLPSWLQIGKLLEDAAEAFATVTEPQCPLED